MRQLRGRGLILIFLAALILRLLFVGAAAFGWIHATGGGQDLVFDDSKDYDSVARNLLEHGVYRETVGKRASRAPGYPVFLAGCYSIGLGYNGVYVVQAIADSITCVLIAALGWRLFGRFAGLAAGGIAAVFPFFIYFSGILLAETLFTLALVAVLYLLARCEMELRAGWKRPLGIALLAGVILGLAIHLRSSIMLFPLVLLPFWLIHQRHKTRALAAWAVFGVMAFLALTPWVVRNHLLFHKFIPTTLQVGESLFEANSEYATGGPAMDRIDWVAERGGVMMNEVENNAYYRQRAAEWIEQNPDRFGRLALVKLLRFWSPVPNYETYRTPWLIVISLVATVPIYLLALWGLWERRGQLSAVLLLVAPVAYFTALHTVFVGSVRYRIPIMPFLIIFAAAGLGGIRHRLRAKHAREVPAHG